MRGRRGERGRRDVPSGSGVKDRASQGGRIMSVLGECLALLSEVPAVQADRVQVQLVLVNLLLNAIDALGEWPSRDRRITVRSTPFEDRGVLIEVSDSGRGIAPGDMERIFEAFMTT